MYNTSSIQMQDTKTLPELYRAFLSISRDETRSREERDHALYEAFDISEEMDKLEGRRK